MVKMILDANVSRTRPKAPEAYLQYVEENEGGKEGRKGRGKKELPPVKHT
jgi:hypothetical protein